MIMAVWILAIGLVAIFTSTVSWQAHEAMQEGCTKPRWFDLTVFLSAALWPLVLLWSYKFIFLGMLR